MGNRECIGVKVVDDPKPHQPERFAQGFGGERPGMVGETDDVAVGRGSDREHRVRRGCLRCLCEKSHDRVGESGEVVAQDRAR